jgi:predicted MFS family arabinose efflux permease
VVLLGLHFLAASLLHSAWVSVFLGILQGFSAAIFTTGTTSAWWALGYGLGSLVGGAVVEAYGAHRLFLVMAGSMFVWSALVNPCKE